VNYTNIHNFTQADFKARFEPLRQALKGYSDEICRLAKVPYRTFVSAKSGVLKNPVKLYRIILACESVYQREYGMPQLSSIDDEGVSTDITQ